ncbi:MAG: NAD(P)/FAD-dependent oxidoreductase [bacterium]|nr:NAD(P)/FAD-dependent oxidoreductase [bacterium]
MQASSTPDFPIAILGAGFAGLGMGIQLKKAGILSFVIIEREDDVGGTWRDNTYPGCACDVPSDVYSYSFELNPDWSRAFSPWDEIRDYLRDCTDKYKLRDHMRLGVAVNEARFDEEAGFWNLSLSDGSTVTARAVVSGLGGLVDPAYPDIKGIHSFAGEVFHTARWNHDYDVAGKRVAVIGTGASAIQVVPEVAKEVAKLSVFQRTAAWVFPKRDYIVKESTKKRYRQFPFLQRAVRLIKYWMSEFVGPFVILDSPRLSGVFERISARHLDSSVVDATIREKLRPDFQFGCKRLLISDDYYPAFNRDNVELVTSGIEEIHANSIETADGVDHPIDALILATGYQLGLATAPFPIIGRDGRSLDDAWSDGAVAYKGVSVSGFPNWFIIMGPNTGPGHTSVLVYTEAQIRHALQAIRKMIAEDIKTVEVKQDVQDTYNTGLQKRMKHTVWTSGCSSWYLNEDGSNHSLYPGLAFEYVLRVRNFKPADYQIVPS